MEEGEGANIVAGRFLDQETSKKCNAGASTTTSQSACCFDCSICLECAVEPVVTLCGHLYCWGCIYRWLRVKTAASPTPRCPVCKAPVSEDALVPLYARGGSSPRSHPKGPHDSLDVPNRPNVLRSRQQQRQQQQQQEVQHDYRHHDHDHCYTWQWGAASVFSSTAGGLLGGLAFALRPSMSRNDYSALRPYQLETSGSGQELRAAESLHEIWIFLLCCAVLCLVFF